MKNSTFAKKSASDWLTISENPSMVVSSTGLQSTQYQKVQEQLIYKSYLFSRIQAVNDQALGQ